MGGIPSWKTLNEAFGPEAAKKIRDLLKDKDDPCSYRGVLAFKQRCFNPPSKVTLKLMALNVIIEGYGIEPVFRLHASTPDIEYVNMGDTYNTTIFYDHTHEEYKVGCWGDWVEKQQRRGRIFE